MPASFCGVDFWTCLYVFLCVYFFLFSGMWEKQRGAQERLIERGYLDTPYSPSRTFEERKGNGVEQEG